MRGLVIKLNQYEVCLNSLNSAESLHVSLQRYREQLSL